GQGFKGVQVALFFFLDNAVRRALVFRIDFNRFSNSFERVDQVNEHFHRIVGDLNDDLHYFPSCSLAHVFKAASMARKRSTYSTWSHIADRNASNSSSLR